MFKVVDSVKFFLAGVFVFVFAGAVKFICSAYKDPKPIYMDGDYIFVGKDHKEY